MYCQQNKAGGFFLFKYVTTKHLALEEANQLQLNTDYIRIEQILRMFGFHEKPETAVVNFKFVVTTAAIQFAYTP